MPPPQCWIRHIADALSHYAIAIATLAAAAAAAITLTHAIAAAFAAALRRWCHAAIRHCDYATRYGCRVVTPRYYATHYITPLMMTPSAMRR